MKAKAKAEAEVFDGIYEPFRLQINLFSYFYT